MDTWIKHPNSLSLEKTFRFESFIKAIEFMKRASIDIDTLNHHPECTNVYNKVTITLRTHDAGNVVTDLDYRLAEMLDAIYEEFEI